MICEVGGGATPILILTSKKHELDMVAGLESGADHYLTKPFSFCKLHARVKALLRRGADLPKDIREYSFGKIHIEFEKRETLKVKQPSRLSLREYKILKYLIQHEGEVVGRHSPLDEVWVTMSFGLRSLLTITYVQSQ